MKDGEPSIIRKLGKYYDYYNTDECAKEWGSFKKFRVIVVQRIEAKREFLLKRLKENYEHRMFWLTTEELYKTDMGGEIFATPGLASSVRCASSSLIQEEEQGYCRLAASNHAGKILSSSHALVVLYPAFEC